MAGKIEIISDDVNIFSSVPLRHDSFESLQTNRNIAFRTCILRAGR